MALSRCTTFKVVAGKVIVTHRSIPLVNLEVEAVNHTRHHIEVTMVLVPKRVVLGVDGVVWSVDSKSDVGGAFVEVDVFKSNHLAETRSQITSPIESIMIHSCIHVLHTERDGGLSKGFGTLVGQHDGDVVVGIGNDMVEGVNHAGEGSVNSVEHAVFLDIDEVLLHLSVLVVGGDMVALGKVGRITIYPYQHTHVAIMRIIGNGEFLFIRFPTLDLRGHGQSSLGDILFTFEVVDTIAVVVDDYHEAGFRGSVALTLVVCYDNGKGVGSSTTYKEGRHFGIERVI